MTFAELFQMIEDLLQGKYDPWAWSFDFPDELIINQEKLKKENLELFNAIANDFPFICADLDDEEELYPPFKAKIEKEYLRIKKLFGIK
jgi:hypothetical protein